MSKGILIALGLIGAAALPIWRGAGHSRHDGVNIFQLFEHSTRGLGPDSPFGYPHIPYDEAVRRAQQAYREKQLYE